MFIGVEDLGTFRLVEVLSVGCQDNWYACGVKLIQRRRKKFSGFELFLNNFSAFLSPNCGRVISESSIKDKN